MPNGPAGKRQCEAAGVGGLDDGCREDVRGDLVQRRGQPEHVVAVDAGCGDDVGDHGAALGERAGLVEQQDGAVGESFQRAATFDDHAAAGCS